jgi:predicted phage tail component-like protein
MANYNLGILYNAGILGGGANYNSATYYIIEVSNAGQGEELIQILANKHIFESGAGNDVVTPYKFPADSCFVITCEGRLNPLGVIVLRDSRYELMPQTRDNTEEIPGRHGEIDFGSELKSRVLELHVAKDEIETAPEKELLRRTFAKYLNPVAGTKKMVFLDNIDVEYEVKYSGKIDLTNYAHWMDFTLPFRMNDPLIAGRDEHTQVGTGTITNEGTFETGLIIEIVGAVTNPSVIIGDVTLTYTGTIAAGQTLVIDTDALTAKIGTTNAMAGYNGEFPLLQPGSVNITAGSNVTVKWKDKYL